MTVALVNAPDNFRVTLGELPEGTKAKNSIGNAGDLTLWFVKSKADLDQNIKRVVQSIGGSKLWIAWPKKGASTVSDLTQQDVREIGFAAGLVDFKICSIDETWSGLLFTRRRK